MLDVAALQQENDALRAQLAALNAQVLQLLKSNADLTELIAKLNERVTELLAVA